MGKKSRHRNRPAPRRFAWHWLVAGGVLLLIVGGLILWTSSNRPKVAPEVVGAPRLSVDQTLVDEGYVKFNVPVRTTYRLSNVGDQPLEIMAALVELVEGC
jgi:hypothetical protein